MVELTNEKREQLRQLVAEVRASLAAGDKPQLTAPDPQAGIARYIDHTLLKPNASADQITQLCDEARENHFASVCVNSTWVPLCANLLKGSEVAVCTVVGFPLGASLTSVKAYEAERAIYHGATEVDMVMNIGALKSDDLDTVCRDMATVAATAHAKNALCKVILETSQLDDAEKVLACEIAKIAQVDFVKTSTGFGGGGATPEDIALMRRTVGPDMGVKASGGVRTYADAKAVVDAGATRIGASAGIAIAQGEKGAASAADSSSDY